MRSPAKLAAAILGVFLAIAAASFAQPPPEAARPKDRAEVRPKQVAVEEAASDTSRSRFLHGKATDDAEALPAISYEDLVHLMRTARRSFVAKHGGHEERAAGYYPPAIEDVTAVIHVTLRRGGRALAEAESPEMQVVDAAAAAGTLLAQAALEKKVKIKDDGGDTGLELEVLGPRCYLDAKYDVNGTWSAELLHSFEPGAEGIGVAFQGRAGWTRPSEVITLNLTPDLALQAAETACGLKHMHKLRSEKDIRYFRFRAYHLWQPDEATLPTVLHRGDSLVPPEPMGAAEFDSAIQRMGTYLHYRQNSDGWFSQQYLPSTDLYGEGNSAAVQMHAMLGLACYARLTEQPAVVADVKKGLGKTAFFLRRISRPVGPTTQGAQEPEFADAGLVLVFPGHEDYLEISSLMLMAMVEMEPFWPGDEPMWRRPGAGDAATSKPAAASQPSEANEVPVPTVREAITGLIECLINAQRDDGGFFVPSSETPETTILAQGGWAMLALARAHGAKTIAGDNRVRERIEQALHRALQYYGPRLAQEFGPQTAAVVARALVVAYAATNDARFSDAAFDVLDRFAAVQVTAEACPWPELQGAINARQLGVIGIDTADYLIPLAQGVALAERVGEKKRAAAYREAVTRGVRFVLQLEVREPGCFYVGNKRDALGGVRIAPWDNRLRADNCAIALECLTEARRSLHGRGDDASR